MAQILARILAVGALALVAGSSAAQMVPLRTGPGDGASCPLMGLGGELRGNAAVATPVWLETDAGTEYEVVWPQGFGARFSPSLELLDPLGGVFAHEGDHLEMLGWPAQDRVWMACNPHVVTARAP